MTLGEPNAGPVLASPFMGTDTRTILEMMEERMVTEALEALAKERKNPKRKRRLPDPESSPPAAAPAVLSVPTPRRTCLKGDTRPV